MLTQAIFDKLWVMDHEIVGSELTDTYHELLTMEARLTLDEQARAEHDARWPQPRSGGTQTYYRRRTGSTEDLSGEDRDDEIADLAQRLWIERPHGALPWTAETPLHMT